MLFQAILVLKEVAGFVVDQKPVSITAGSHVKLEITIIDSHGRPVTITGKTIKLRLRLANDSISEKTATNIDNVKGRAELTLLPADTLALMQGKDLPAEVIIETAATPDVKTFVPIEKALSVSSQSLV